MAYGHGKVILFGEHAVVYGHPAVAVAIERAAEVTWERASGPVTRLTIQPGDTRVDTGSEPNAGRELLQRVRIPKITSWNFEHDNFPFDGKFRRRRFNPIEKWLPQFTGLNSIYPLENHRKRKRILPIEAHLLAPVRVEKPFLIKSEGVCD